MQSAELSLQIVPSSGEPIYRQLIMQIQRMIAGGQLKQGDYLPSVRQLATQLDVNPMTISKAYGLLEAQHTVERIRGKGMMISDSATHTSLIQKLEHLQPLKEQLAQQCQQLDISTDQAINWLLEQLNKGQN